MTPFDVPNPTHLLTPKLRKLLKAVSRSFYLSLVFLPAPMWGPASIGYLVARALDSIADHPALNFSQKEILLNRLFAYFQNLNPEGEWPQTSTVTYALDLTSVFCKYGYAIPMEVQVLPQVLAEGLLELKPSLRALLLKVWLKLCYGMIVQNQAAGFEVKSNLELADYCYYAAGCVGEFWAELIHLNWPQPQPVLHTIYHLAKKCGVVLQKVNIIRDAADDAQRAHYYLPPHYYSLGSMRGANEIRSWNCENLQELIFKTEKDCYVIFDWLGRISITQLKFAWPLYFCSLLPFLLAQATLQQIKKKVQVATSAYPSQRLDLAVTRTKINRWRVYFQLVKCLFLSLQMYFHHQSQKQKKP